MSEQVTVYREQGVEISTAPNDGIPRTWCVAECPGCHESWTLETADWTPGLNAAEAERLVAPILGGHRCAP